MNHEGVHKVSRLDFTGVTRALQSDINISYSPQPQTSAGQLARPVHENGQPLTAQSVQYHSQAKLQGVLGRKSMYETFLIATLSRDWLWGGAGSPTTTYLIFSFMLYSLAVFRRCSTITWWWSKSFSTTAPASIKGHSCTKRSNYSDSSCIVYGRGGWSKLGSLQKGTLTLKIC